MAKDFLPKKFRDGHAFCFFLHDQMLETLLSAGKAKVFNTTIKFGDMKDSKKVKGLSSEQFIDWLQKNGYEQEVYLLYYKQLIPALLSDFLHFVYEALQASKKGKLTVAYALLRKPFKENLLYLEWLLADPTDFLTRFDSPQGPRLSFPTEQTRSKQIEIIDTALKKTEYPDIFGAEFVHGLRYDKSAIHGLESSWQKANHLITTYRYMQMERANFNFIFSDNKAHYSQWNHLYSFLPVLLFHTVQIIEALLANISKRKNAEGDTMPLRTIIGLSLWFENHPWLEKESSFIKDIFFVEETACPKCNHQIKIGKGNLKSIYLYNSIKCYKCKHEYDLSKI
jgi:uncharacterized protein (DUF983 family)